MHERDLSDLDGGVTVRQALLPDDAADTFVLTVLEGPERGAAFTLDAREAFPVLVGQSPACRVRLTDPTVSRRHASLDVGAPGMLRIADLGSTNGTFVDNVAVHDAEVAPGQVVRLGATTFTLARYDAGPADELDPRESFGRIVGRSAAMRRLYPLFDRIAASRVPVVIEGETGTGKEALAESLHEAGPRAAGPFVVFDCTAVPANLMEAELFGHERGAFTGAVGTRRGVFEQAHGGTLLIDEIGDLELTLQPKLLRAIERSEIRRIGAEHATRVDVRVLAATRRDLDREVQEGRFRDDLLHRLAVGRVELPPLRRRAGDVELLARRHWEELGGDPAALAPELLRRWQAMTWPGNVRQLRNAVARQLALGDDVGRDAAAESDAPMSLRGATSARPPPPPGADPFAVVIGERLPLPLARLRVVEAFERRYIETVLAEHGGNVAQAAKASGIARRYFQLLRSGKRR
ncbi:MAG TPA: sigma 54-interacting transcriptional regulator [Minicystis sp.]|nr:sigma 54-interacting transcriptional regulator [Minicystis sp.]